MNQMVKLAGMNVEKRVVRDISANIKPGESIISTCSKHQISHDVNDALCFPGNVVSMNYVYHDNTAPVSRDL